MIGLPSETRVWLASGATDMRRGFNGLALLVQETLLRDPHCGHLFVFRGKRGGLLKILWHDGQGLCLFAKRLERGRFVWPRTEGEAVTITPAQLGYLARKPRSRSLPRQGPDGQTIEGTHLERTVYSARQRQIGYHPSAAGFKNKCALAIVLNYPDIVHRHDHSAMSAPAE